MSEQQFDRDVLEQQEAVRRSGKVNMFDLRGVQWVANEAEFYDLVLFIEDNDSQEYLRMAESAAKQFGDGQTLRYSV